ncbi:hypothetical protein HJA83_09885 [Rhizobium bangladeshense]|uniref:hypothetical protein n=1 Tax=Rhizobium bangladeshense TaxID=1138189 RepID=UPI001C83B377|nr:hypothetical protein [Rhizobium bangladeshense]MBX4901644.1 hypothetical protein [Rhizobium bangladeshense]
MQKWYAVKTMPGAQQPQREYAVEKTGSKRGKGYRIVPSLNPNMSAVERALSDNGFSHYMPAEKRLIRDRRHTDLWKVRRFALMVGYVFVRDPHDFRLLEETPGVDMLIRDSSGVPYSIDLLDILEVRKSEAEAELEFDRQSLRARQNARKKAKDDPRLQMLIAKLDIAGNITFSPAEEIAAA